MKTIEDFDAIIRADKGIFASVIKEKLNVSNRRFYALSDRSLANRKRVGMKTAYWFDEEPASFEVAEVEDEDRANIAIPYTLYKTRWIGGNPFKPCSENSPKNT